jgi:hypothetical protein
MHQCQYTQFYQSYPEGPKNTVVVGDLNTPHHHPNKKINKEILEEVQRWWLQGGSRKRASYSEILERRQRHTLQA